MDDRSVTELAEEELRETSGEVLDMRREVGQPIGLLTPAHVKRIEEQVMLLKKARAALLSITNADDWTNLEGKPYLTDSGIHKVAFATGVQFGEPKIVETQGVEEDDNYLGYTCELRAHWNGRSICEIGMSSTRDKFFAKRKGQAVPFNEIDLSSVKKKCVTNAQHRCLVKILGLSFSRAEVEAAGIDFTRSGATRFRGGRREDGVGSWTALKKRLQEMLLELHGGEEEKIAASLKQRIGKASVVELTHADVEAIYPRVEDAYRKLLEERAARAGDLGGEPEGEGETPEAGREGPRTDRQLRTDIGGLIAALKGAGKDPGVTIDDVTELSRQDLEEWEAHLRGMLEEEEEEETSA